MMGDCCWAGIKFRTGMRILWDGWDWLVEGTGLDWSWTNQLGDEAGGLDQNNMFPQQFIHCNA